MDWGYECTNDGNFRFLQYSINEAERVEKEKQLEVGLEFGSDDENESSEEESDSDTEEDYY